jgi:hypothetical protein
MGGKEYHCPVEVREFCQFDETSNSLYAAQTSFAFAVNQMPAVFRGVFGTRLSLKTLSACRASSQV